MEQQIYLKQYQFAIPASALALTDIKGKHIVAEHPALMKVKIDFEDGTLELEGNWQFLMSSKKHIEAGRLSPHRERVEIKTYFNPALAINRYDENNELLICQLKGNIKDGNSIAQCSGLLIVENAPAREVFISSHWNISFCIYDTVFDDCEIEFKLPVYICGINSHLN